MAYYDAFIAQYNAAAGSTTHAKIDAVNALAVTSLTLNLIPSYTIRAAIDATEWGQQTTAKQNAIMTVLGGGPFDASQGSRDRAILANVFSGMTNTLAALNALGKIPWWQANGYFRAFHLGDAVICGLDTSTGYSATIGVATAFGQNITVAVTITGPNGSLDIPAGPGNTVTADYAKYHAANQIFAMMGRDAALATF